MNWSLPVAGAAALLLMMRPVAAEDSPPSPQDFAMAAEQSDAYEVAAARVAQLQSQNKSIRDFAGQMIHDHMAARAALLRAASKSNLPPPPDGLGADQAHLLYALQSAKGPEFDRMYVTQQVVAHQGALTVEEQYANSGTDPNLKQAAAAAVPMIRHHLDMAKELAAAAGQ